jgi:hypothetical protein
MVGREGARVRRRVGDSLKLNSQEPLIAVSIARINEFAFQCQHAKGVLRHTSPGFGLAIGLVLAAA